MPATYGRAPQPVSSLESLESGIDRFCFSAQHRRHPPQIGGKYEHRASLVSNVRRRLLSFVASNGVPNTELTQNLRGNPRWLTHPLRPASDIRPVTISIRLLSRSLAEPLAPSRGDFLLLMRSAEQRVVPRTDTSFVHSSARSRANDDVGVAGLRPSSQRFPPLAHSSCENLSLTDFSLWRFPSTVRWIDEFHYRLDRRPVGKLVSGGVLLLTANFSADWEKESHREASYDACALSSGLQGCDRSDMHVVCAPDDFRKMTQSSKSPNKSGETT